MVGIVGSIGDRAQVRLDSHLQWSESEQAQYYEDPRFSVCGTFHGDSKDTQPAATEDGSAVAWVLGEIYGFEETHGYTPCPPGVGSATYCADLYETHGLDFVEGVNGNFLAIIYDSATESVHIISDRLGTISLFYTLVDDNELCFSTSIQTLANQSAVDAEFDVSYLHEFLVFKRAFGVVTPLKGIKRHPPGSVTTVDLEAGEFENTSYWEPTYRPKDESFGYFVDRFVEIFEAVMGEWVREDRAYGLLLSGGSDSRLCLAGFDRDAQVTALHMSGWMSREARMAERAALTAGADFEWLRRDSDYQKESLERNPRMANFNGWFSQAYVTGFSEQIAENCDVLVTGMYADTLFKGHAIPSPAVDLGRVGEFELPIQRSIDSVDEYIDSLLAGVSDELSLPTDLREVLSNNIHAVDDGIIHHGVRYGSLEDLIQCGTWYPLTNDDDMIFWDCLHHLRPYRTPYLDNRFIDLSLEMPRRYQLRRNIVNRALERIAPDLAEIPHSHTGIAPRRSYPVEFLGTVANAFWQKHIRGERPPKRFLSNGPWVDDAELIRTHNFAVDAYEDNKELIDKLPFLDRENVMKCFDRHLRGENRIVEIYGLLSLLEMPITEQIIENEAAKGNSVAAAKASPPQAQQSLARGGLND